MPKRPTISPEHVHTFVDDLVGEDLHAKRVASLAHATTGVIAAGALGVHAIGRGLAAARGVVDKHAIKQVDRLLSNDGIDLDTIGRLWVAYVLRGAREVAINMDWTEFDSDDHSMLVLSVQTDHGRSTPLLWRTVRKSELAGKRNDIEDQLLLRLRDALPAGIGVTIVADRGFADTKLYALLESIGFGYVIRFRSDIYVTSAQGETRRASEWIGRTGRAKLLRNATVTRGEASVPTVVCVKATGMKDAWCLVASSSTATSANLVKLYGRRFTIEEMFRDVKDLRYGMGMSWNPIRKPERRDRMFLLAALAQALLTVLGSAGERAGLDRLLKSNTSKTRTLSLFRQGLLWYERLPNMPLERLRTLMREFGSMLAEERVFALCLELG